MLSELIDLIDDIQYGRFNFTNDILEDLYLWSSKVIGEIQSKNGYKLQKKLDSLFSTGNPEEIAFQMSLLKILIKVKDAYQDYKMLQSSTSSYDSYCDPSQSEEHNNYCTSQSLETSSYSEDFTDSPMNYSLTNSKNSCSNTYDISTSEDYYEKSPTTNDCSFSFSKYEKYFSTSSLDDSSEDYSSYSNSSSSFSDDCSYSYGKYEKYLNSSYDESYDEFDDSHFFSKYSKYLSSSSVDYTSSENNSSSYKPSYSSNKCQPSNSPLEASDNYTNQYTIPLEVIQNEASKGIVEEEPVSVQNSPSPEVASTPTNTENEPTPVEAPPKTFSKRERFIKGLDFNIEL